MVKKITEFTFKVENQPGAFAKVAEYIGQEGVNINAAFGLATEGKGIIHVTTSNPTATADALNKAGVKYDKHELYEVKLQDKPGILAKFAKDLAAEKVNINSYYITMAQTLVFDVDNHAAAEKVFSKASY